MNIFIITLMSLHLSCFAGDPKDGGDESTTHVEEMKSGKNNVLVI